MQNAAVRRLIRAGVGRVIAIDEAAGRAVGHGRRARTHAVWPRGVVGGEVGLMCDAKSQPQIA